MTMVVSPKDSPGNRQRPNWREYQQQLRRPRNLVTLRRLTVAGIMVAGVFCALIMGLAATRPVDLLLPATAVDRAAPAVTEATLIGRNDVQLLLSQMPFQDLMAAEVSLPISNQPFRVATSLDEALQARLNRAMDHRHARFIGIVAMEAQTGRVRAMVGFDKLDPEANPCLSSIFPAASLFKIITAAAVVDQYGYTGNTQLRFNGYKHTMYRNQLQETNNRYTHTISFADAFAESVNPVFGKLGKLNLGKTLLERYGADFGFNRPIDFELPVAPSHLAVKESPYHWAEIASGFNRETTISPLHAAMIISAALNRGRMVTPTLVERIEDPNGRIIYKAAEAWSGTAMSPKAATVLTEIMETTVQSGTARSVFSGWQRDPVLSALRIGGKTGSISTRQRDARIDWFAGFAQTKNGEEPLVVAALVAHQEYIGVRAGTYARTAITHYFRNLQARQENRAGQTDG